VTLTASGANAYVWNNSVVNGVAFTPGNAGSYNFTVTGTDNNGCEDSDDVTVTVISAPNVSFVADVTSGCVPLSVNFTNTGDSGVNCIWSMGDGTVINDCGNVSHLFTQLGCNDITLTVTNSTGCTNNQVLANYICVEGPPTASFISTPGVINEFESTVNFNNTSSNATAYVWDFGDNSGTSSETDPEHEYDGSVLGNYTVTLYAYSALGCIDSIQGAIQYQEELIYYVPNTFTPDGDMFNQTFKPIFTSGYDPYNYVLYIYNRWGELIFESRDPDYGWDGTYNGKLVQQGTYTWVIEFKAPNNDKKFVETGYVHFLK
jgi:gliding motility-associated-like protein